MQCPKCNSRIRKTSVYCNTCGAKINEIKEIQYETKEKNDEDITLEVMDAYMATGKEDLKKGNFSFPAFIFGPLYYFYRKTYIEAIILLILEIIIFFFGGTKFLALNICIHLYSGFTFKRHYIRHVKEEANKIISCNISGKKVNALIAAYNNGGTSTTPIAVIVFLFFFVIMGSAFYSIITDESLYEDDNYYTDHPLIETLNYKVPTGFVKDARSTDTYKLYSTKDKYCNFYISENYLGGYDPKRHDYGVGSIEHLSTEGSDEQIINGYRWKYEEEITKTSKTYNLKYEGEYIEYDVSFFYIDDEAHAYCEESYEELKNSLKLE